MKISKFLKIIFRYIMATLSTGPVVFGMEGSHFFTLRDKGEKWDPHGRLPDDSYAGT